MLRSQSRALGRRQRIQELSRLCIRMWGLAAGLMLVILAAAAWYGIQADRRATASDHLPEIALRDNEDVVYDLSRLDPGQTRFFTLPCELF
jgi:hypothetical protein